MSTKISRKDFLKGTAATVAGIGIIGITGCSPKVASPEPAGEAEGTQTEQTAAADDINPVGTYD